MMTAREHFESQTAPPADRRGRRDFNRWRVYLAGVAIGQTHEEAYARVQLVLDTVDRIKSAVGGRVASTAHLRDRRSFAESIRQICNNGESE